MTDRHRWMVLMLTRRSWQTYLPRLVHFCCQHKVIGSSLGTTTTPCTPSHLIAGGPAICRKTEREREKTEITLVSIQMWGSRFCSASPKGHAQRLGLVVKKKKKTCSRDLQASVGKHCVKTSKQVETVVCHVAIFCYVIHISHWAGESLLQI